MTSGGAPRVGSGNALCGRGGGLLSKLLAGGLVGDGRCRATELLGRVVVSRIVDVMLLIGLFGLEAIEVLLKMGLGS